MRRAFICLLMGVMMMVNTAGAALPEGFFADAIPTSYIGYSAKPGRVIVTRYASQDYLNGTGPTEKQAVIYLPWGYDESEKYDVLVLCHGIGGTEGEWGFNKYFSDQKNMVDHLIEEGAIRPLIIVMPNGRSCANFNDTSMQNADAFYVFGQELRNDLLPWLKENYATWGDDREHWAMAGLSMGGMQTINIGLCECPDLFAWFGAFSPAPTTYAAEEIQARLKTFPDLPIRYFYAICGTEDSLYFAGEAAAKHIDQVSDRFTGDNWHWQERRGGHDFNIWNLGLYNFVRIFAGEE